MMYKIFFIKWIDSFGCSSHWGPIDELKTIKPEICLSVGYKVFENDDYIVICPHVAPKNESIGKEESDGMGELSIPKCSIKEIKEIS